MSIDRRALVTRHNPVLRKPHYQAPLSVGNGELAFTADITGLQSFPDAYMGDDKTPLCTMSQWGWHSFALPAAPPLQPYLWPSGHGRHIPYYTHKDADEIMYRWQRENPHRLHLGRIGLHIRLADGGTASIDDLKDIRQELSLWSGVLSSRFVVEGIPVQVETCCHPRSDCLGFAVESPLLAQQRLHVDLVFPYGSPDKAAADWHSPERHTTTVRKSTAGHWLMERCLDDDTYYVGVACHHHASLLQKGNHHWVLQPPSGKAFSWTVAFGSEQVDPVDDFSDVKERSAEHWQRFWSTGGAIQFSGSSDPRAPELERRVVLSQYLTAIQCAGSLPPQETGLTVNSWHGKFHLEMHFWHAAHFALWGRVALLERSLWWYRATLEEARRLAASQGFAGARWPKMVGPDGRDSPSPIGPLLVWQQPHPIVYAELCYRAQPTEETLERHKDVVFATAAFLASFLVYNQQRDCFELAPPLIPAQECHDPLDTRNPTLELAYFAHGLRLAQSWRERLGLTRDAYWDEILNKLASLPIDDGVYLAHENCPTTFREYTVDHPSMLGALGMLPGMNAEPAVMNATLDRVWEHWQFSQFSWGWDYPLMAMTAARLGRPERAVDALLLPERTNTYLPNGHNFVRTPDLLQYLPANGGLLLAVAMMAAGWEGGPGSHAPGFPADGSWQVQWEGLQPML